MNPKVITMDDRVAQLQQRCEQQRQQLNQHFAAIETQLQAADAIVSTLGGAIRRPELWLAALTGLWAIKRSSLWSLIGRGWMVWSVARRVMKWFSKTE
jgi:hypothetical protein